jgi:hypothetical protein
MKEIKLWKIAVDEKGKPLVEEFNNVNQTETENYLEEIIVRSPNILLNDLKLVGRQTETPGGALDLLGVDSDGNLVVFELKRGTLTREAVAQIIDYASYLSELAHDELSKHISDRSGKLGIDKIDDFRSWYQEQFSRDLPMIHKIKMFLVGLGVDDRARRMLSYLSKSDIDISLTTFYGFERDGNIFLARHVEIESKTLDVTTHPKKSNLEKLQKRVKDLQVDDFYYEMSSFFRNQLSAYEWPNPSGYSYSLSELTESGSPSYRVYISLYLFDAQPGKVQIYMQPRALEKITADLFQSIKDSLGSKIKFTGHGAPVIWVKSSKEWKELRPIFEKICTAIIEGGKRKREQEVVEEFQEASQDSVETEKSKEAPQN